MPLNFASASLTAEKKVSQSSSMIRRFNVILGAKSSYIIKVRIHCIDECLAIQDLRGTFTGLESVQVALPPLAHVVKAMSQPLFFKSIKTFLAQKKGLSASVKNKENKDKFDKCNFFSLTTT